MLETIRSLVGGTRGRVLYECRHCGTAVDGPNAACPECDSADVARYLL